jgi:hypothetical protein
MEESRQFSEAERQRQERAAEAQRQRLASLPPKARLALAEAGRASQAEEEAWRKGWEDHGAAFAAGDEEGMEAAAQRGPAATRARVEAFNRFSTMARASRHAPRSWVRPRRRAPARRRRIATRRTTGTDPPSDEGDADSVGPRGLGAPR